ncbi:MAG: UDP-N-acetylmuramoyl-L-alanine--D-glutamate ligase [Clostridiales bacterium]|nr:UDP-N-acetylmuramoyl-L-alanine--D-glutamate ligase [Clostridiales bacterium]
MYVKNQKFLIIGASKSGFAVAKYLVDNNAFCRVYEEMKSAKAIQAIDRLKTLGIENLAREQAETLIKEIDVLVLSPGVPINHELAVKAKQMGKRIMGEIEFAYDAMLPPIIAVTGTNGKTTTVTMIDEILERAGVKRELVGNVGVPITAKLNDIDRETVCVTEVSSFQLESINSFCPHISCVLNISPDHLERHYTMENYIYLKKRIFKNQKESEYCVLNFNDQTVKNFYTECKAKIIWVSIKGKVDGAYLDGGKLYYNNEYVLDAAELMLAGEHNVQNALFAIACAKLLGINTTEIASALKGFKGVKHRVEFVAEKYGVEYYNDSKATNTASTIVALDCMKKPTVLILGGSEKGEDYNLLFEKIKSSLVKRVIICGASRFSMLEAAKNNGVENLTLTDDFFVAIKIAKLVSCEGDAVLLSPACASYDCFNGFEDRGNAFINAVGEL